VLEDRLLPSASFFPAQLLKDVNGLAENSSPGPFVQVNNLTFFAASDGSNHGRELWKTDGTRAGTAMVLDINPGPNGSNPQNLTNVNGTLFFQADDGTDGAELWKSNGTAAGTVLVQDIRTGSIGSNPNYLTNVNGTLFFQANNTPFQQTQLWRSNGTAAGTFMVGSVSYPRLLTNLNGTLFFSGFDFAHGHELWRSDGTAGGTQLVADINPGSGNSYPASQGLGFVDVNGTLFFSANDGTHGYELWKSNGSAGGTTLVADINPGTSSFPSSYPSYATNLNGTLFFSATDGTRGQELWKSNGTAAGTVLVKNVNPAATPFDSVTQLTNLNGTLFFNANDGTHGKELWESNGAAAGTRLVLDINSTGDSDPKYLTNVNGTLFFKATDGSSHGAELWRSNGTASGTRLVADINPGSAGSYPKYLTNANGTLLFSADDGARGVQLWRSNGAASGTVLVRDINPETQDSNPANFAEMNGTIFFAATDGVHGKELWQSNGTPPGTSLVADINPGSGDSSPQYLTNVNGTLFFSANDGSNGPQLWETNGTGGGTQMVLVPDDEGPIFFNPIDLTNINGRLFFLATDHTNGTQLWASDGTAAGTQPLGGGQEAKLLTSVNGTVFFVTNDGIHGDQLWDSNGSRSATHMVADINGTNGSYAKYLTNVNGTLFFRADDGTHGTELWKSNGTAVGTVMVKDVNSNFSNGSYPKYLTNVNGTVFFRATDGTNGQQLWESNGAAAGTQMLTNVNASPGIDQLTNVSGTLFFRAADSGNGLQLWKSNGSAAGTGMITNINHPYGPNPMSLTNVNGELFFSANDGTHGTELWQSNGTAAGTNLVQDINPGSPSSYPKYLTNINGSLLFQANDGVHGVEPWIMFRLVPTLSTVTSSPSQAVFGQIVTFTATVSGAYPLGGTPTGTVTFKEGTKVLAANAALSGLGKATFTSAALAVGTHALTSFYSGSSTFAAGQGTGFSLVVQQDGVNIAVTSSASSSVFGQVVTLTAIVSARAPGAGAPTGTVTFKQRAIVLADSVPVGPGGKATFSTSSLSVGSHSVTASYGGDGNFTTGAAAPFTQKVNQDATTTSVKSFVNPSVFGQAVIFIATVTANAPGAGIPTHLVTFKDGMTVLGTGTLNGVGQATLSVSGLAAGNHTITASYGGDMNFIAGTSALYGQMVEKDGTSTSLAGAPNPAVLGQTVTFTASVKANAPAGAIPSGMVVFQDGTASLGSVSLDASGRATLTTAALALGTHVITAAYQGNGNFLGSPSAPLFETINHAATSASMIPILLPNGGQLSEIPASSGAASARETAHSSPARSIPALNAMRVDGFFDSAQPNGQRVAAMEAKPKRISPLSDDWMANAL
jgi:ELWxxDGT repeat protein